MAWVPEVGLPELQAASRLLLLHLAVAVLGGGGGCRMSRGSKRAVGFRCEGTSQTGVDL